MLATATNIAYNVAVDGPAVHGPPPTLPTTEEKTPHEKAKEYLPYLEVGIVIGDDPTKFKPQGTSRSKREPRNNKVEVIVEVLEETGKDVLKVE